MVKRLTLNLKLYEREKFLRDTKFGALLKEKAPKVFEVIGDVLPNSGALGLVKNIIQHSDDIDPETKKMLHDQLIESYKTEVADRDSARKREVEIAKVRKFDLMFNLTGIVGLGSFSFFSICYCIFKYSRG